MNTVFDFDSVTDKGFCSGLLLVKDISFTNKRDGSLMASGTLQEKSETIQFKVFDSGYAEDLKKHPERILNHVVRFEGKGNLWNGTTSILVNFFEVTDLDISAYKEPVNMEKLNALVKDFKSSLHSFMSEQAVHVVTTVLTGEVLQRFVVEYAAKSYHDNVQSGLLMHTLKMMKITDTLIKVEGLEEYRDILMVGVVLHDIGKVNELHEGVYQPYAAVVTHRIMGIEHLMYHKNAIIALKDEKFFYDLVSIMAGHHHTYDDKARTVWAYLIHLVDNLEAKATMIHQTLVDESYTQESCGNCMFLDDTRMYF